MVSFMVRNYISLPLMQASALWSVVTTSSACLAKMVNRQPDLLANRGPYSSPFMAGRFLTEYKDLEAFHWHRCGEENMPQWFVF